MPGNCFTTITNCLRIAVIICKLLLCPFTTYSRRCKSSIKCFLVCLFIPQYVQLVRDIDNYLHTVMSEENVTKLLRKLTKSQQKTSLILSVLQEVELWERTQDKFVAILEEEYPLYRDVVTPFTVAVFQVWNFDLMQMHFEYGNAD